MQDKFCGTCVERNSNNTCGCPMVTLRYDGDIPVVAVVVATVTTKACGFYRSIKKAA